MKRLLLLALLFPGIAGAAPKDPWASLRFLIGTWEGEGEGDPGTGTGTFSLLPDLENKVLFRRSSSDYPAKPGDKRMVHHEDLMLIYPSGNGQKAIFFDNEGHVIEYAVTTAKGSAVFESDAKEKVPRFKLAYAEKPGGILELTFSIAPPGKPYQTYLTAKMKRGH